MKNQKAQKKRHFIDGKIIVGIDPAKDKHQAIMISDKGDPLGSSFTIKHSYFGFHISLFKKLKERINDVDPEQVVFAVEISINFWQKLCQFLHQKGFTVLMISPLATKHERPKMSRSFSKTDPKDALAIANIARQGYFNFYKAYSEQVQAMHRYSLTYDKITKDIKRIKQRIRAQVELLFPEFSDVVGLDTDTARHLLSRFISNDDFLNINLFTEVIEVRKKSRNQYDLKHLKELKQKARESIGLSIKNEAHLAERLTMTAWLETLETLFKQRDIILNELVNLAQQSSFFEIITSIKGISKISAARFMAETRELGEFNHAKQIEVLAGTNLKLSDSGRYSGYRRITHIGNHRLRAIIYKMSEETKNYIPEVRIRFIKRQLKRGLYTKNVIAVSSNMLKLVMALIRDNRVYQENPDIKRELETVWEPKYKEHKNKKKKIKKAA